MEIPFEETVAEARQRAIQNRRGAAHTMAFGAFATALGLSIGAVAADAFVLALALTLMASGIFVSIIGVLMVIDFRGRVLIGRESITFVDDGDRTLRRVAPMRGRWAGSILRNHGRVMVPTRLGFPLPFTNSRICDELDGERTERDVQVSSSEEGGR
jgi:hypothetical protein